MTGKSLVIVESPNKIKKIQKFLGNEYIVKASCGHIRDLDRKDLSIDTANNFKPTYKTNSDKANVISDLKSAFRGCDTCYLASDYDREGESIAWHVSQILKLNSSNRKRILFTEITKSAILKSLEKPTDIDMNMFYAQQARRILDRLIGYKISPILWKQIQSSYKKDGSLSAGRVQSVIVRLILEREAAIKEFESGSYFKTLGTFNDGGTGVKEISGELSTQFKTGDESMEFLEACQDAEFVVDGVSTKISTRNPSPPFITSTLQQEASNKFKMAPKTTMLHAQKLYEAGYITYMRTDSVVLSEEAIELIKDKVVTKYGEEYYKLREYKNKSKNSQEAHEAIRPCDFDLEFIDDDDIDPRARKLYNLIYRRTIASQMESAKIEIVTTRINISTREEQFISKGERVKFDGFLRVYREDTGGNEDGSEDGEDGAGDGSENKKEIIKFKKNQKLNRVKISSNEKITKPPVARYTEASLIKELDKRGIGRPSTYSTMISNIQDRSYVQKRDKEGEKKIVKVLMLLAGTDEIVNKSDNVKIGGEKQKLFPNSIGEIVTDFLIKNFPEIMSYDFTSRIEEDLDKIASGDKNWVDVVRGVYDVFNPTVVKMLGSTNLERDKHRRVLGTDEETGAEISVYIGKFGPVAKRSGGTVDDRFAPIKEADIKNITLREALQLFKYPKRICSISGKGVTLNSGKYGLYLKYNGKNYSTNGKSEADLTEDECRAIIEGNGKTTGDSKGYYRKINDKIEIKTGKYGSYICYKSKLNVKIYGKKPEDLTEEDCIIAINKKKASSKK